MTITRQTERGRVPRGQAEREYSADSIFTATEVQSLHTAAVPIVRSEGSGTVILPTLIYVRYDYETAAFGAIGTGDDIFVRWADSANTLVARVETTSFLDQTPSSPPYIIKVRNNEVSNINSLASTTISSLQDTDIDVQLGGAITGGGASTLSFRIYYRVLAI